MKIINPEPQSDEEKPVKVFWQRPGFWVILLLLAGASVYYKDSWQDIWTGIQQITRGELLHCILFSVAAYFLEGMTIACMMNTVLPSLPVKKGVNIAYLCEFYRLITLGNGSGFAEIYYLHKNKIETGTATALTMLQYICKRTAIIILGSIGFGILFFRCDTQALCKDYVGFMIIGYVVSLLVITLFLCVALLNKVASVILKLMEWTVTKKPSWERRVYAWKEQIVLLNQSGRIILGQKYKIILVILLQTGKLFLFYAIPAYLLRGCLQSQVALPDFLLCILLMSVAYMLSGVIPAPSGVGSLEFVFLLFFSGVAKTQTAVPAILVFRFATWVIPFMIGGVINLVSASERSK